MGYITYCDESVKRGDYFSNFYGGALVRSTDFYEVKNVLELKNEELYLFQEAKYSILIAHLERGKAISCQKEHCIGVSRSGFCKMMSELLKFTLTLMLI